MSFRYAFGFTVFLSWMISLGHVPQMQDFIAQEQWGMFFLIVGGSLYPVAMLMATIFPRDPLYLFGFTLCVGAFVVVYYHLDMTFFMCYMIVVWMFMAVRHAKHINKKKSA